MEHKWASIILVTLFNILRLARLGSLFTYYAIKTNEKYVASNFCSTKMRAEQGQSKP